MTIDVNLSGDFSANAAIAPLRALAISADVILKEIVGSSSFPAKKLTTVSHAPYLLILSAFTVAPLISTDAEGFSLWTSIPKAVENLTRVAATSSLVAMILLSLTPKEFATRLVVSVIFATKGLPSATTTDL